MIGTWASRDGSRYGNPRPAREIEMLNAAIEAIVRETRQESQD
jgi:hypothetical protein